MVRFSLSSLNLSPALLHLPDLPNIFTPSPLSAGPSGVVNESVSGGSSPSSGARVTGSGQSPPVTNHHHVSQSANPADINTPQVSQANY